ncbi:hypothetical protein DTL42_13185 [Bremerella cremea]|uniref:Uncharacterized protein n=1 Tax=Bremerella cremea TaxID=1031537 RepID=A0A368KTM5_9BACT|nr:hypothetical protein [Bremerella cremea]RCS49472.1 hypothetical protein DTL42_13185 [Bremerella cremea]
MSRQRSAKRWLHKASGFGCATISGKREYLDRDYKVACRKLNELRAAEKRVEAGVHEWLDAPFVTLADEYLSDVENPILIGPWSHEGRASASRGTLSGSGSCAMGKLPQMRPFSIISDIVVVTVLISGLQIYYETLFPFPYDLKLFSTQATSSESLYRMTKLS